MARIKQRKLEYFPLDTDFMSNRAVRRIMKREGDAAMTVLLQTLCAIYSGEGYYVRADEMFYEDLADSFFQLETEQVKRIIALAVEYGIFDEEMYRCNGVLTSVNIQKQYKLCTRRRIQNCIDEYCLISEEGVPAQPEEIPAESTKVTVESVKVPVEPAKSTQSKVKESKVKENPLLNGSPENGKTPEDAGRMPAEEETGKRQKREWTMDDVERLVPPTDDLRRNLPGLKMNLAQFKVPPQEQYAIILKSNFGVIGHPMWKAFQSLRDSHGKIRQPGRYLLSFCR